MIKEDIVPNFIILLCNICQNKYCLKILKIINYSVGNHFRDLCKL